MRDIPTVRVERIGEHNRIFESEARSGADRVVRRAQRIPRQYHILERPAVIRWLRTFERSLDAH